MKSILLALAATLSFISAPALADLVKQVDDKNGCTIYRSTSEEKPATLDETVVSDVTLYGFVLRNMDIDFNRKQVTVDIVMSVVLGRNKNLTTGRAFIRSDNPQFHFLLNQLNRNILNLDRVCVTEKNELVYASGI